MWINISNGVDKPCEKSIIKEYPFEGGFYYTNMDIKLKFPKKEILSFLGNIAAWTHRCFKQPKNPSILIGLVFLICFFGFLGIKEHIAKADLDGFSIEEILTKLTSVQGNSLLALSNPNQPEL